MSPVTICLDRVEAEPERRCSDCGTALGELNHDGTGDWLCRDCYCKRPGPTMPVPDEELCPRARTDADHVEVVAKDGARIVLTPASEIEPEAVRWLARERLPLRALTVVAGPPGLGKSTLVSGSLAARLTRGTLDGDLDGPRDVLVASIEDDWPSVIVPRAMAYDADRTRLHRLAVKDSEGRPRPLSLPGDVPVLAARCAELHEQGRPVGLVVIDPLGAHLDGRTDSHRDASVRRALGPLADMAMRLDLVVVGIAHLTKDESKRLLDRVAGSVAFGGAPRSVLVFMRDPDDPEGEEGDLRVLAHAKANWGRYAPTLSARVESRMVDLPDGRQADIGHVVLLGTSTVRREELSGADSDTDHADTEEAVTAALANGPRPSREVKAQVARELRCAIPTVKRAAQRMARRGELRVEQSGFPRTTTWALAVGSPPSDPTGGDPTDSTGKSGVPKPDSGGAQLQWDHTQNGDPTGPFSAIFDYEEGGG
jgi:RecA-family ATPase